MGRLLVEEHTTKPELERDAVTEDYVICRPTGYYYSHEQFPYILIDSVHKCKTRSVCSGF